MAQKVDCEGAELELGYWAIRGLAQPIRFLLTYAQIQFSEVRLGIDADGHFIDDEEKDWMDLKNTLSMEFPNLPYLIDARGPEKIYLTQSNAILRYLARQFDFYGDSVREQTWIDILQEEAYDLRNSIIKAVYTLGDDYEEAFHKFKTTDMPRYIDRFENYLDQREIHDYFVGTRLSLVDFVLYELIWQVSGMIPGAISKTSRPNLCYFVNNFENIEDISNYMKSSSYIDRPINSIWASFS